MSKKKDNNVYIIGNNISDNVIAYVFNGENYVKLDFFVAKINEKDKLILDLEAKLAEKERENNDLYTAINLSIPNQIAMKDEIERLHTCRDERISELVEENNNLKQQLAEKDAELEEVKRHRTQILNFGKRTKKVVIVNPYGEDCVVYNQEDQDKISFCIEKLEKVKEFCFEKRTVDDFGVLTITVDEDLGTRDNLLHFIDNQIKQLKEGK